MNDEERKKYPLVFVQNNFQFVQQSVKSMRVYRVCGSIFFFAFTFAHRRKYFNKFVS